MMTAHPDTLLDVVHDLESWGNEYFTHYQDSKSARTILDPIQKYRHSPEVLRELIQQTESGVVHGLNNIESANRLIVEKNARIAELQERVNGLESLLETAQRCALCLSQVYHSRRR